jgi:hypothetical protein
MSEFARMSYGLAEWQLRRTVARPTHELAIHGDCSGNGLREFGRKFLLI